MTASAPHLDSNAGDGTTYRVRAPARLHLGFVDLNGGLGRRFGSIGLAIDGLDTLVSATQADRPRVEAPDARTAARASELLKRLGEKLGTSRALRVRVQSTAPAHAGLGSGTTLALTLARAAARALGASTSVRELAGLLERGQRSGIGIAAFEGGGFVVDGGRGSQTETPPLLARLRFPDGWRCVLIFDDRLEGLSGRYERAAFARLAPMDPAVAGALAREVLVALMPALVEADFPTFSRAVAAVQAANGEYFAPAQGGTYRSPRVGELLRAVAREFGCPGIGQSSWGPTGFVFTPDAACAASVASFVDARKAEGLRCRIVAGNNVGARCGVPEEYDAETPPRRIPQPKRGYQS